MYHVFDHVCVLIFASNLKNMVLTDMHYMQDTYQRAEVVFISKSLAVIEQLIYTKTAKLQKGYGPQKASKL